MASRTTTTPSLLRKTLKRHGLSMRKNALQVALQCVVSVTTAGYYSEEDTCDKLLEFIEDEGVTSCVVDEKTVNAAAKKLIEQTKEGEEKNDDDDFDIDNDRKAATSSAGADRRGEAKGGATNTKVHFVVDDAFDKTKHQSRPPLSWDEVHGKFVRRSRASCLTPPASAKMAMFRERFFLLRRRVQRNKLFLKPALEQIGRSSTYCELTEISALLGCVGEAKYILCMISTVDHEDGRVYVEDLSGTVEVDLNHCLFHSKGFYTENMIVLVEGRMQTSGTFQASAICFPPLDTLESDDTHVELRQRNALAPGSSPATKENESFALMSEVHLDNPECMSKLSKVFERFESSKFIPTLFVLMGPFVSDSSSLVDAHKTYTKCFKELANTIKKHTTIHQSSCFLFVPGPGDLSPLGESLLPQPRLHSYLTQVLEDELKYCIFGSNPCRIRHAGQEIVIFRDDLQNKLRRHDLSHVFQEAAAEDKNEEEVAPMNVDSINDDGNQVVESKASEDAEDLGRARRERALSSFERTCSTVLHQSHLVPLPSFSHPVMWDYDQAMWLHPVPSVLVLGDRSHSSSLSQQVFVWNHEKAAAEEEKDKKETAQGAAAKTTTTALEAEGKKESEGVSCLCPGDFATHGNFLVFTPKTRLAQPATIEV